MQPPLPLLRRRIASEWAMLARRSLARRGISPKCTFRARIDDDLHAHLGEAGGGSEIHNTLRGVWGEYEARGF